MQARKICYVAPDVPIPSPRGSSVHVTELAENLALLGHDVHVLCRRKDKSEAKTERVKHFTVHRVNRWIVRSSRKSRDDQGAYQSHSAFVDRLYYLYLLTIFRIYVSFVATRLIGKYNLDVILERETSFGAGGLASLWTGKELILEIVGPRYSRMSVRQSKAILYYTESMLRRWVNKEKCTSVPAGVNLELFHKNDSQRIEVRKKLGVESDQILIGYVGTFQKWHGIDTLIEAVKATARSHQGLRLLLVGPGFQFFKERAENAGISDLCIFPGPVEYELVPSYINACDIMVALYEPSKDPIREKYGIGWPLKILEYMACNKPTISTRVDPVTRIISSDDYGYLVEPDSPMQLSSAIHELGANRAERERIGENGRTLVEKEYSWSNVARILIKLF